MFEIILIKDSLYWDQVVMSFKDHDVYYLSGYVKAFQVHGDGEPLLFYYHDAGLRGVCVFMKRDISMLPIYASLLTPREYFDLLTPYGYGGFIFEGDTSQKTFHVFQEAFVELLQREKIVSLFIRYHPQIENARYLPSLFSPVDVGKTIEMDIRSPEVIWNNLTSKNRNMIRKAGKLGVSICHGKGLQLFAVFKKIYNSTMDKDNASAYYYFEDQFYLSINNDFASNHEIFYALYGGKIVAMSIMLYANQRMHYHLSGSFWEYRSLAASNLLLYEAACWGSQQGFKTFHLGGGLGAKEDGLFRFKQAFSRSQGRVFSVGKCVVNADVYAKLVKMRETYDKNFDMNSLFFPLYRGM